MSGISGTLCITDEELRKAASKRRKPFLSQSVKNNQVDELKLKGWEIIRAGKTKVKMRKTKAPCDLFEDRVWMNFYNLGFTHMNKDRKCGTVNYFV